MLRIVDDKQTNINQYVKRSVIVVNVVLCICHILLGVFFKQYDVDIMYYYNFLSMSVYVIGFVALYLKKTSVYVVCIYAEILVFMMLAVICMGWEFGFQQYCIGFITASIFTDFYMSRMHKLKKRTVFIVTMYVVMYVGMRIWTYQMPYIYEINNELVQELLYIANTTISFVFLIAYSCIYSNTVFKLEKALTEAANVDVLTGLRNRRKMQDLLKTSYEDYVKQNYNMCVAIIDVDHFKVINDTYGHDIGDVVLKTLADILLNEHKCNGRFHACRWGGEEFLILYKKYEKSKEEIISEFDTLRKTVENNIVVCDDYEIKFTITIGVAFWTEDSNVSDMIKKADKNLYNGKENGRNKVVCEE